MTSKITKYRSKCNRIQYEVQYIVKETSSFSISVLKSKVLTKIKMIMKKKGKEIHIILTAIINTFRKAI